MADKEVHTDEALHESAKRLHQAMKELVGVEGKSAIAHYLNESPQVVQNWGSVKRDGVSKAGALKAQARVGCDANWILTGEGGMKLGWPFKRVPLQRFLKLESDDRTFLEGVLSREIDRLDPQPDGAHGGAKRPQTVSRATNSPRQHRKKSA